MRGSGSVGSDGGQTSASLFAAVDAALRPAGMLSDLSRIVAQFARPIRWTDDPHFATDAEGSVSLTRAHGALSTWAFSDVPIGQFPSPPPSGDVKEVGSLRAWTIRIDSAEEIVHLGIAKPSLAAGYEPSTDPRTISVTIIDGYLYRGGEKRTYFAFPFSPDYPVAVGALYQFTADL